MLLCHGRVRTDSVTHTVKNSHTDMLKLIRCYPERFTGRTTSETLRLRLDTVLCGSAKVSFLYHVGTETFSRGRPRGDPPF